MSPDSGTVYIDDAQARYGKYVHEGTRRVDADPFLTDAFDSQQRVLDEDVDRAVDAAITQAFL
jgi:hypothetical protein